jgi:hypothetical protein
VGQVNGLAKYKPEPLPEPPARPADVVGLYSASAYLSTFKPIETIVDGLPIPRGGLVSLTAPTGHGKTTITTLLEIALARGEPFAGRDTLTEGGSVLVLAGESPEDWGMHFAATMGDRGLTLKTIKNRESGANVYMVPGVFNVTLGLDYLAHAVGTMCDKLAAVIVDTSAAFYSADDENDNASMRHHAAALRELSTLPGNPAVIVLCHPVKNAQRDNLLPRGGGAFLAEVDANLTLWKDASGVIELSWSGKIRGPSFDPLRFELVPITLDFKDARGRPLQSVAARHLADERAEEMHAKEGDDEDVLLSAMRRNPGGTLRDLAMACGWVSPTMQPLVGRAGRRMQALAGHGLVEQDRKKQWKLTSKGMKEAGTVA